MLRKWKSIVRGLKNSCAATARLLRPLATRPVICTSCAVSSSRVLGSRLRAVWPLAPSSLLARSAQGSAPSASKPSSATRRCSRASTLRRERLRNSRTRARYARAGTAGPRRDARPARRLAAAWSLERTARQRSDKALAHPSPVLWAGSPGLEHGEPGAGHFDITAADRSLDPVRPGPQRDRQLADLPRTHKCLVQASLSELKCQHRPARRQRDVRQIPRRGEVAALSRKRMTLLVSPRRAAITASTESMCATT
jgi:hypothetical protein